MRARTHTHTHPKHMPTLWACLWAFKDLKKTYPGLRTKHLKLPQFLALFRHFSMEYNIAQLVWKALGRCAAEGFKKLNSPFDGRNSLILNLLQTSTGTTYNLLFSDLTQKWAVCGSLTNDISSCILRSMDPSAQIGYNSHSHI